MVRIAITIEAFEAICATVPVGSVMYEPQTSANGKRLIWLERKVLDQLDAMRGRRESYSDVIIRLAGMEQ
jgi:hypothetical protein